MRRAASLLALIGTLLLVGSTQAAEPDTRLTVYDATDDCSATGAIEFYGLGDGIVGFVVPDGTLYFDDGLYPIAPGAYTATIEKPGQATYQILDFVIHDCQKPVQRVTHKAQAPAKPLPTLPPTDTE